MQKQQVLPNDLEGVCALPESPQNSVSHTPEITPAIYNNRRKKRSVSGVKKNGSYYLFLDIIFSFLSFKRIGPADYPCRIAFLSSKRIFSHGQNERARA